MNESNALLTDQHALVVTPFLPVPDDAGQRKRVMQMHRILRAAGCRITMLHYAVEHSFGWAHHDGLTAQAGQLVDELITVYPGQAYGSAPANGSAHMLDEWWDPLLSEALRRLFARRWFDLVIVNNVWLTKVFDFAPPGTVRILESHDVFSDRIQALRAIGHPPDFFVCERSDEAFGWNRSDIVVAITDREASVVAPHLQRATAVALPYAEPTQPPRRRDYLSPGKVTFGFIGSGHPFNVQGLRTLIREMRLVARWAPIELVIAGEVGRSLNPDEVALVTDLGYVRDPQDFYDRVDLFVSPLDHGSGLKIKVVECISLGIPALVTAHSAIGACLDSALVVPDVRALAQAMARIAWQRPTLDRLADAVDGSQQALVDAVTEGTRALVDSIRVKQKRIVLRYRELALPIDAPVVWILLGMMRELANRYPVIIDLGEIADEPGWIKYMPPRIQLVGGTGPRGKDESRPRVRRERLADPLAVTYVFSNDPEYRVPSAALHVYDERWTCIAAPAHATHCLKAEQGLIPTAPRATSLPAPPWCSPSVLWEPALPKVRRSGHGILLLPDPLSQAATVLADLATHLCPCPLRVFGESRQLETGGFLSDTRSDRPLWVLHLTTPQAHNSLAAHWCDVSQIPYRAAATAAEIMLWLREPPSYQHRDLHRPWAETLTLLFSAG